MVKAAYPYEQAVGLLHGGFVMRKASTVSALLRQYGSLRRIPARQLSEIGLRLVDQDGIPRLRPVSSTPPSNDAIDHRDLLQQARERFEVVVGPEEWKSIGVFIPQEVRRAVGDWFEGGSVELRRGMQYFIDRMRKMFPSDATLLPAAFILAPAATDFCELIIAHGADRHLLRRWARDAGDAWVVHLQMLVPIPRNGFVSEDVLMDFRALTLLWAHCLGHLVGTRNECVRDPFQVNWTLHFEEGAVSAVPGLESATEQVVAQTIQLL